MKNTFLRVAGVIAVVALVCSLPASAVSPNIVISQVYGGGGNSGSTYTNDFIELFNRGGSPQSLNGWSVQYASATGTTWAVTNLTNVTLQPGQYYLVQEAQGAGGTTPLPSPDVVPASPIAMAAAAGKVALVSSTVALSGACPSGGSIVDFVGFGTTANCNEGGANTPAPSNTTAVLRAGSGCTDTDTNSTDFSAGAPTPRNTFTTFAPCVAPTPTISVDDVTHVEGNAGTTAYTFTVTLANGTGPVSFDIATADNTATLADSDYVANSATSQSVSTGSPVTFTVNVNGDLAVEGSESFFVNLTNVTPGTTLGKIQGVGTITNDDAGLVLIHDIQGNGATSPLVGSLVTIDGIVVGSFQGATGLGGFFVEEEDADQDADPATSEGIFVFSTATPVAVGDRVTVTGTVAESFSQTELSPVTSTVVVSSLNTLPTVATMNVPAVVDPATDWERFEGMRVHIPQTLYITNSFYTGKYGETGLSTGGVLPQPTNFIDPNDNPASGTLHGPPNTNVAAVTAQANANTNNLITLDDGFGATNVSPEVYPPSTMRLGNSVAGLDGVVTFQFGFYYVEPVGAAPTFSATNPRPAGPPAVGSPTVKVSFHNTLNFFVNTQDIQPPSLKRGAADAAEFTRQRDKLVAALSGIGADVIGLSELEKDPAAITPALPQNAAAASLATGMTAATSHAWAAITDPWGCETLSTAGCNPGTDPAIKCGIIYDTTKVTPVGGSFTDLVAPAGDYSRAPYAQVFQIISTGGKFAVVVNHMRSKSCPGTGLDNDQGDGQGCFNARRTNQALDTSTFVASAAFTGVPNVLVMGDMNAYAEEDPIDAFRANGFVDLLPANTTSYSFSGLSGHIDHALCTAAMLPFVTGAGVWHINADEPVVTDYVMSGKPADAPYAADAFRCSDHDPVLVGILGTVPVTLTNFSAE